METAHNYLARTPAPPRAYEKTAEDDPTWHGQEVLPAIGSQDFKEAALTAFQELERVLVAWQGYEQDKLA